MFFKLPWFKKKSPSFDDTQVLELDFLVDEFHDAVADIQDPLRRQLHASLMRCQTPKDLWFLRSKLHSLISAHHCEQVANERVSRLDQKMRFFVDHHPDHDSQELPSRPMPLAHQSTY